MNFSGARVAILGAGSSGTAAARALHELGASVELFDASPQAIESCETELAQGVEFRVEEDPQLLAKKVLDSSAKLVIVSPGFSPQTPVLQALQGQPREVWSEIELAWQIQQNVFQQQVPWLNITGTNGKTTTVTILASILQANGEAAKAVGNIGSPIVETVMAQNCDVLAVELSSFQLHFISTVSAEAAVCLNVSPDHIDWHGNFSAYKTDKARIYQQVKQAAIYIAAEPETIEMVAEADVLAGARAIGVSLDIPRPSELGLFEDVLLDRAFLDTRHTEAVTLAELSDLEHFAGAKPSFAVLTDVLAAAALARAHGVSPESVKQGLRNYLPPAHRRAQLGEVAEVSWVDDSKATNAHAAAASLAAVPPGTAVWIAGGVTKGQDFTALVRQVRPRLRGVVLIGTDPVPLRDAITQEAPEVPMVIVEPHDDFMMSAVHESVALSRPGDTVVLAPACASWDQFNSYTERGAEFTKCVERLAAQQGGDNRYEPL